MERTDMDEMHDPFEDQVACARYRAERDMLAQAMGRVADDIERTFLGFEGAEDAPAMRWAREFRAALGSLHAPVRDATTSACDLTPDEDREAAAWVRNHGGIDYVKREWRSRVPHDLYERRRQRLLDHIAECETALGRRNVRIEELGHRVNDLTNVNAELRRRAMPEGCEWPRYESGEPVRIGDVVNDVEVRSVVFRDGGILLSDCTSVPGWGTWRSYKEPIKHPAVLAADDDGCCEPGTYRCQEAAFTCDSCGHTVFVDKCMVDEIRYLRAKGIRTFNCCCGHGGKVEPFIIVNECDECRMLDMGYERRVNEHGVTYFMPKSSCPPKVIAADGEPLEVGQTVWNDVGYEFNVEEVDANNQSFTAIRDFDESRCDGLNPRAFTHQRPVLDADGVPIKKGDTVYWLEHIVAFTVVRPHETHDNDGHELKCGHTVEIAREGHEPHMYVHPESLHHTKPEPPDSWERIEEDKGLNPFDYCKKVGHKLWTFDNAEEFKASDLVHRAKALAGVSE